MFSGTAQKALDMARDVSARQSEHEKLCAQRQGQIVADLKEVKDFLKKAFWALLCAALAVLYNILHTRGTL